MLLLIQFELIVLFQSLPRITTKCYYYYLKSSGVKIVWLHCTIQSVRKLFSGWKVSIVSQLSEYLKFEAIRGIKPRIKLIKGFELNKQTRPMRVLLFTEWLIIIIWLTEIIFFHLLLKLNGAKKSQELHLNTCISTVFFGTSLPKSHKF